MIINLSRCLKENGSKEIKGIKVVEAESQAEAEKTTECVLCNSLSKNSVLFLSGGKTPLQLYKKLAEQEHFRCGAIALIDERYGVSPENTNEGMVRSSGLTSRMKTSGNSFYKILKKNLTIQETVKRYNGILERLFADANSKIAIMGIGEDGHTAGLPFRSQESKVPPIRRAGKSQKYVIGIDDFPGEFKHRVTLNFNALSQMDLLIILVFGENKKKALKMMFENDMTIAKLPAKIYLRHEIAKKTLLITDQKI